MKALILCLLFVLSSSLVLAATIQGTIYDLELKEVKDAIIEINTEPPQLIVSKDGNYSLIIEDGLYILSAKHKEAGSINRKITVKEEGSYNLDLILFPSLELEREFFNESDIDISYEVLEQENDRSVQYILGILVVALISYLIYLKTKKQHTKIEEVKTIDESQKVLYIIKQEGGRITQKDLRKKLPYSEAKASLIIKDLETKGKLEKIKQGNKNIIVLK